MNSLSWLIYWADIVHGLTVVFIIIGITGVVVALFLWIDGASKRDNVPRDHWYSSKKEKAADQERQVAHPMYQLGHRQQYVAYAVLPATCLFFLLAVAIPSSKAIYMIAASEMGEETYKQFVDSDLYKSLKKILENELGALIPQDKPKTAPPPAAGEPT
jgi:hypothetical protein